MVHGSLSSCAILRNGITRFSHYLVAVVVVNVCLWNLDSIKAICNTSKRNALLQKRCWFGVGVSVGYRNDRWFRCSTRADGVGMLNATQ